MALMVRRSVDFYRNFASRNLVMVGMELGHMEQVVRGAVCMVLAALRVMDQQQEVDLVEVSVRMEQLVGLLGALLVRRMAQD